MPWTPRLLGAISTLAILCTSAWALMPPHVTSTNIAGGVLEGEELVVKGYSLTYTDVPKELSLTHAKDKKAVSWKHKMACAEEGRCDDSAPPGSCQLRCVLTVTLSGLKDGDTLRLRYLDLDTTFRMKGEKRP